MLTPTAVALAGLGAGLDGVDKLEARRFYSQLLAGVSDQTGLYARAEVGGRPNNWLSIFGRGGWERDAGWGAGVGLRAEW